MLLLALFAQAPTKAKGSPFDRPELLWGAAGLAGALLVGAVAIYLVDKWRKRAALEDRESAGELTSFRAMYERGEITEAEYNRLRQKVADRVKKPAATTAASPTLNGSAAATVDVPPQAPAPGPAVPGPFPPGYFDDPPPTGPTPPPSPGGGTPSA
jgi:hypothetical protein